jgi:hypothetical protein
MKAAAGFFDNRMQGNDNEASCLAARTITSRYRVSLLGKTNVREFGVHGFADNAVL